MSMKGRESGMPDEAYWASFFEAEAAIDRLLGTAVLGDVIEFGCGYGSFTVPTARRTAGRVIALDIEPEMVDCVRHKAVTFDLPNIQADVRDFVAHGTGGLRVASARDDFQPVAPRTAYFPAARSLPDLAGRWRAFGDSLAQ